MSILTHDSILDLIKANEIKIDPFIESQVGPASVDLHLGNIFRVFIDNCGLFDATEESGFEKITQTITVPDDESLILLPGKMCHGITVERITLPANICGWLGGRSSFGRLGILVHDTANFVQPGIDNHQVLEISNNGPLLLRIKPKVAICQLILEECRGSAKYQGRFAEQIMP